MNKLQHWDIVLSNQVAKKDFIKTILDKKATGELTFLNSKKGLLFSDLAIEKFIEKEEQYDLLVAAKDSERKLRTFSSGERKKAFLTYCINQQPDFIILDNPLDHLDAQSRIDLVRNLELLAEKVILIQLVNRAIDLLSFIENKAQIVDHSFELQAIDTHTIALEPFKTNEVPNPITPIECAFETLVQMNNVCVSYLEKPILKDINWTIKKGEFWQLIGPNGSGKSTILSLISGDNAKGYGQDLHLFGIKKGSGESIWDIKKNIGIFSTAMMDLFQRNQTVEQMILSGFFDSIGLYIQPTSIQKKIVEQWLELINKSDLKNKKFNQLSLGEQRLILIIRAILKHPPLLILDEPVEGLDDQNTALVIQLINFLAKNTTMAIIFVSHRIEPLLSPKAIYELIPNQAGSLGKVKR